MTENFDKQFISDMRSLLGENGAKAFFASYAEEPVCSLRVNTLKTKDIKDLFTDVPFTPVPWCKNAYFYPSSFRAGKTAAHLAGAYYIQEASATFPVTVLDIKEGEKVLDLCAAPGGKSTQIAELLNGTGLLVSNEIVPSRASSLSQNIERLGVKNAVVLNADPRDLEDRFFGFFDKILVDAPCSGEGMFRKNPEAAKERTADSPAICAARQRELLKSAFRMLKKGGVLVYSTCTFNKEENEENVAAILRECEYVQLYPIKTDIPQPELYDVKADKEIISGTVRIMPHLARGEGHFCARFIKTDGDEGKVRPLKRASNRAFDAAFKKFADKFLNIKPAADLFFGDYGYCTPADCPDLSRLRVLRAGVQLGQLVKDRFEPSHSFALSLKADEVKNVLSLEEGSDKATAYLMGETLPCDFEGWTLVTVGALPLGWGKASGGVLKNHLPKGLRINR